MKIVTLGHEDGSKMGGDDQVSLCGPCYSELEHTKCVPGSPFMWSIRRTRDADPYEGETCDGCGNELEPVYF